MPTKACRSYTDRRAINLKSRRTVKSKNIHLSSAGVSTHTVRRITDP
jgi:hypothetical protein